MTLRSQKHHTLIATGCDDLQALRRAVDLAPRGPGGALGAQTRHRQQEEGPQRPRGR